MTVTSQQTISLLENVLFETPAQAAANAGTWIANPAAASVSSLAAAMAGSGEEKIAATVVGYYLSALDRAPSAAEIRYYVGIAEQGLTQSQIAAGDVSDATWDTIGSYFSHSAEFTARGGLDRNIGLSQTGLLLQAVPWLYESVLGRAPSNAEISYYDNQVVGGTDISVLFREFTASPEFHVDTDGQISAALAAYGSAAASGQQPSATIGSTVVLGPQAPATPPSPPPPAPAFGTLTTGADTINDAAISGAHTYDAILGAGATLNAGDSLTGNGLSTLAVTDGIAGAQDHMPAATLQGISALTFTTAGNAGSGDGFNTFDISGVAGLTSFTLASSGTNGDWISATSAVDVTVASVSNTVYVQNAHTLSITDNSLTILDLLLAITGGVTLNDSQTTVTINPGSLALTGGIATDNHITHLTISGSGSASSIDTLGDTALTNLTVNGPVILGSAGAALELTSATTVTLTNDTATSYIQLDNDAAVTLGLTGGHIDMDGHVGTIATGADGGFVQNSAANQPSAVFDRLGSGTTIALSADSALNNDFNATLVSPTSTADAINQLASLAAAVPHRAFFAAYNGNTYIVESSSGSLGPTVTSVIEIVGTTTSFTISGNHLVIS